MSNPSSLSSSNWDGRRIVDGENKRKRMVSASPVQAPSRWGSLPGFDLSSPTNLKASQVSSSLKATSSSGPGPSKRHQKESMTMQPPESYASVLKNKSYVSPIEENLSKKKLDFSNTGEEVDEPEDPPPQPIEKSIEEGENPIIDSQSISNPMTTTPTTTTSSSSFQVIQSTILKEDIIAKFSVKKGVSWCDDDDEPDSPPPPTSVPESMSKTTCSVSQVPNETTHTAESSDHDDDAAADAFSYTPVAKLADLKETDAHRLDQRQKQIMFGKNTRGYHIYLQTVPKKSRIPRHKNHPVTPDVHSKCSKRAFDGQLRAWRRALHFWDPEELVYCEPDTVVEPSSLSGKEPLTNIDEKASFGFPTTSKAHVTSLMDDKKLIDESSSYSNIVDESSTISRTIYDKFDFQFHG